MTVEEIASAVYNNTISGLVGFASTPTMSLEQLADEVIAERQAVIREWYWKGQLPIRDMLLAINCIPVDCKDMSDCCGFEFGQDAMHFEIPPLMNELDSKALKFVGSVDKQNSFWIYYTNSFQYHKYRKRGADEAYVYIETTPNENGMYNGWLFNAPFVKYISVVGVFRDPRMLEMYNCCDKTHSTNMGALSNEIIKRLTEKKIRWYRQLYPGPHPNDQTPR